jgi:hypothetical protein
MKILATILMFYFSSLIAQPMATLVHNGLTREKPACSTDREVCTMNTCCKHCKLPEKKQTREAGSGQAQKLPFGCCANDMSNPFAQCCCCTGFIPEKQNTKLILFPNSTVQVFTGTGVLVHNYSSDCWHPPEMAA